MLNVYVFMDRKTFLENKAISASHIRNRPELILFFGLYIFNMTFTHIAVVWTSFDSLFV